MASLKATANNAIVKPKQTNLPSQTLYCTNLSDKIQKDDLRRALYLLFSTYGPVLDVVALKTMKMRGQAHIVFRDVQTSSQAMRTLQGFEFFGKELRISYAKGKSAVISKLDGTTAAASLSQIKQDPSVSTDLQRSIFNSPFASKQQIEVNGSARLKALDVAVHEDEERGNGKGSQGGVKRRRTDESDDEDAPMEEDEEDDDDAMEESDDDD